MNHALVKSALLSMGVHALLLAPVVSMGGLESHVRSDVMPGLSSIELEFISPTPAEEKGDDQEPVGPSEISRPQEWLQDDGARMERVDSGLYNPAPRYPWLARIQGWQGTVVVRAWVTPVGRAGAIRVVQSSGHSLLDQAAVSSLSQWQFVPARRQGQQVASWVEVPVTFQLKQEE